MGKLKIAWMIIAQWIMLVGVLDAGTVALYQEALVAEKQRGDLNGALLIYEQIVTQDRGEDAWLMARALTRIVVLRERLGLPKWVEPSEDAGIQISVRQFLRRGSSTKSNWPYFNTLDQQVVDLRFRLGMDRFVMDKPDKTRGRGSLEMWFDQVRHKLGIQSFAEKLAEAAEKRRRLRPMTVAALYQAGLDAEKGLGDFEMAIGYYDRALHQTSDGVLHDQVIKRLDFCRRRIKD